MSWSRFLSILTGRNGSCDGSDPESTSSTEQLQELNDPDVVEFGELPPGDIYRVEERAGKSILIIDLENASDDRWEASKSELRSEFQESGGISVETASPIVSAFSDEETRSYLDEMEGFYRDKLPPRIVTMIRESIVLRTATETSNLSLEEVRRRKRQIAKYGDEGFGIASLCSAGYFDEGRLMWELYETMVLRGRHTQDEYRETFHRLVREQPFVVFV